MRKNGTFLKRTAMLAFLLSTSVSALPEEENRGPQGNTPSSAAALSFASELPEADRKKNTQDLFKAFWEPKPESVILEIIHKGVDLEASVFLRTPLYLAALNGYVDVVNLLIEKGANKEATNFSQWTPLHEAAYIGKLEVVQALLDHKADVNALTYPGKSALQLSAEEKHWPSFATLLSRGDDVTLAHALAESVMKNITKQNAKEVAQAFLSLPNLSPEATTRITTFIEKGPFGFYNIYAFLPKSQAFTQLHNDSLSLVSRLPRDIVNLINEWLLPPVTTKAPEKKD